MSLFNLKRFSIPSRNNISLKTAAIRKGAVIIESEIKFPFSPSSDTGRTDLEPRARQQLLEVMDSENVYRNREGYSALDARIRKELSSLRSSERIIVGNMNPKSSTSSFKLHKQASIINDKLQVYKSLVSTYMTASNKTKARLFTQKPTDPKRVRIKIKQNMQTYFKLHQTHISKASRRI